MVGRCESKMSMDAFILSPQRVFCSWVNNCGRMGKTKLVLFFTQNQSNWKHCFDMYKSSGAIIPSSIIAIIWAFVNCIQLSRAQKVVMWMNVVIRAYRTTQRRNTLVNFKPTMSCYITQNISQHSFLQIWQCKCSYMPLIHLTVTSKCSISENEFSSNHHYEDMCWVR